MKFKTKPIEVIKSILFSKSHLGKKHKALNNKSQRKKKLKTEYWQLSKLSI